MTAFVCHVITTMLVAAPVESTAAGEQTLLATVLKSEPKWTALPAERPAALLRLLRRCLEKDRGVGWILLPLHG
jgi:hypothetical protein